MNDLLDYLFLIELLHCVQCSACRIFNICNILLCYAYDVTIVSRQSLKTWTVRCCINFHFKNFQLAANPTNHQQFEIYWNTRYVWLLSVVVVSLFSFVSHSHNLDLIVNVRSFGIFCICWKVSCKKCVVVCVFVCTGAGVSEQKSKSKYKINTTIIQILWTLNMWHCCRPAIFFSFSFSYYQI